MKAQIIARHIFTQVIEEKFPIIDEQLDRTILDDCGIHDLIYRTRPPMFISAEIDKFILSETNDYWNISNH